MSRERGLRGGMIAAWACCLLAGARFDPAWAGMLRHQILDSDSPDSYQSMRSCHSFRKAGDRFDCLPMSYSPVTGGSISLDAHIKANESAFNVVNKVLKKDVDEEYLANLFENENFQDVSGSVLFKAVYGPTRFEYQPAHVMGAFKLSNPALPELNLSGLQQNIIKLSHYFLIEPGIMRDTGGFVIGVSASRHTRRFAFISTDALSIVGRQPSELIEKKTQRGYDAELNLAYLSRIWAVPSLYLKTESLLSDSDCRACASRLIDIESLLLRRSQAIMQWSVDHYIGQSFLAFHLPFTGLFEVHRTLDASASFTFKLSRLGAFVGMSAMMQTFGFVFDAANYKIGLQYSDEKQDNEIALKRIKHTYVSGSYKL